MPGRGGWLPGPRLGADAPSRGDKKEGCARAPHLSSRPQIVVPGLTRDPEVPVPLGRDRGRLAPGSPLRSVRGDKGGVPSGVAKGGRGNDKREWRFIRGDGRGAPCFLKLSSRPPHLSSRLLPSRGRPVRHALRVPLLSGVEKAARRPPLFRFQLIATSAMSWGQRRTKTRHRAGHQRRCPPAGFNPGRAPAREAGIFAPSPWTSWARDRTRHGAGP